MKKNIETLKKELDELWEKLIFENEGVAKELLRNQINRVEGVMILLEKDSD